MRDSADSTAESVFGQFPGVLPRPPFQLRSLPIRYRWEVTRRHPYFQDWWETARAHYQNETAEHLAGSLIRQAAVAILGAIGVSDAPPDPATDFDELDSADLDLAWLSGAVHPITLRGLAALMRLLGDWKSERGLQERRDRSDKYAEYLHIWDQREGWADGSYDRTKERKLREIAADLKLSVTTVHNHYRGAFELIVGHPYSPELWYRLFGPLKTSELYGTEPGPVSQRRPSISPVRRDVPETVVSPTPEDGHYQGVVTAGATTSGDQDYRQLMSDISELLGKGRTDRQIVDELDLSDAAIDAIAYLRERRDESP